MYIWHYKSTSTIMFTIMFCVSQCMLYDNSFPWRQLIFWYLAWSSACLGSSDARATTLGGMLCCTSVAVDAASPGALAAALWGKLSCTGVAAGDAPSGLLHKTPTTNKIHKPIDQPIPKIWKNSTMR